ncbi:MAG: STAS domain-containing protein [Actinomycetota bacterium]|nr:STAS domain-containing protein [Actinomycetota bacterium]
MTTPPFTVSYQQTPSGVLRICLSGEFDMSAGGTLTQALVDAAVRPHVTQILVDLEHTRLIDSYAVAALVAGYQAAATAQRTFTVVNGHGIVQQVLDITGLSEVLCR